MLPAAAGGGGGGRVWHRPVAARRPAATLLCQLLSQWTHEDGISAHVQARPRRRRHKVARISHTAAGAWIALSNVTGQNTNVN